MININDSKIKTNSKGLRQTYYRCHCDKCGADRGYQEKRMADKICSTCRNSNFGSIISKIGVEASIKVNTGSKWTEERKQTAILNMTGRTHTEESKLKMSQIAIEKGRKGPDSSTRTKESYKKISESLKGKKPSEETRLKIANTLRGRVGCRLGSIMSEEQKILHSCKTRGISTEEFTGFATKGTRKENENLNKKIREECYIRDNYTCLKCNDKGGNLNAHHKYSWKFFPDKRYELDNLVTMCVKCHKQFHREFGQGIKEPNTGEQFLEFLNKKSS